MGLNPGRLGSFAGTSGSGILLQSGYKSHSGTWFTNVAARSSLWFCVCKVIKLRMRAQYKAGCVWGDWILSLTQLPVSFLFSLCFPSFSFFVFFLFSFLSFLFSSFLFVLFSFLFLFCFLFVFLPFDGLVAEVPATQRRLCNPKKKNPI